MITSLCRKSQSVQGHLDFLAKPAFYCVLLAVVDAEAGNYRQIGMAISDLNILAVEGYVMNIQYRHEHMPIYKTPQVTMPIEVCAMRSTSFAPSSGLL